MKYLYITRHGETQWNLEGRFQGRGNSELTERGRRQAQGLGRVLDEEAIELIITSPLKRARQTAEFARGNRNIPLQELEDLAELDLGAWEGQLLKDLKEREPQQYHYYWNDPFRYEPSQGESYAQMLERLSRALVQIEAIAQGRRTLVVTHGMTLMGLLHLLTGAPLERILKKPVLRQTSITKVRILSQDPMNFEVETVGDTSHFISEDLHSPRVNVWDHGNAAGQNQPAVEPSVTAAEPTGAATEETLGQQAARRLLEKNLTISTAESLTGGLLAGALIDSELGISRSFLEGYITYSNEAKIRDLGVLPETLAQFGAVSEETAREMVLGCQAKSDTDLAVSTTGIAGPGGETPEKPVGLTFIALYDRGRVQVFREIFPGTRNEVRAAVVRYALERLIEALKD
ncbi:nicotinamide-nucleotide amidohydrolase family protein [Clostridiaceae bacterium HFYG-1003]|nr:nicotinamide-nucleotide amidohydrolase family protein [Clostridiaceae bacterium HFYG-1003]